MLWVELSPFQPARLAVFSLGISCVIGSSLPVHPQGKCEEGGCCHLATLPYAWVSVFIALVR